MSVVFSTCWYCLKAKYDRGLYHSWIDYMLSNVNQYYLVIYTNKESYPIINKYAENPRIKIVLKEIEDFYYYRYKDLWIRNHAYNTSINTRTTWEVNMLWCEKTRFVQQTRRENLFSMDDNIWYGWCDIGYFRPHSLDPRYTSMTMEELSNWPNPEKITELNRTKIHYGLVNTFIMPMIQIVKAKNDFGLPETPIPPNQVSVAGGFFLTTCENLDWWAETFETRLRLYFEHDYLVKDDQMIIIDCILSNNHRFKLHRYESDTFDNWFMFQKLLA